MFKIPEYKYIKVKGECSAEICEKVKNNIEKQRNNKTNKKIISNCLEDMLQKDSKIYYVKIINASPFEMKDIYRYFTRNYQHCFRYYDEKKDESVYKLCFKSYGINENASLKKVLEKCFDYSEFSKKAKGKEKWDAYKLCRELDIHVCPYCNHQFIFNVEEDNGDKIARAQLDHYFLKSKYPMFALSFINLIPCCSNCNSSIKGIKDLDIDKHVHPYIREEGDFTFRYKLRDIITKDNSIEVLLDYNKDEKGKVENTCDFFKIKELYQCHENLIKRYLTEAEDFPVSLLDEYRSFLENVTNRRYSRECIISEKFRIRDEPEIDTIMGKFRKEVVKQIINEKYK